jgi:hypothetical protein
MPIHPFDPSKTDEDREAPPDIGDVVDRILDGGDHVFRHATDR